MSGITLIGSGMAACQLISDIRKIDQFIDLTVISPFLCDRYAKPQLSMLSRMKKKTSSIISMPHEQFCDVFRLDYHQASVENIDLVRKKIFSSSGQSFNYETLVLAHGAKPLLPFDHCDHIFTLEATKKAYEKLRPDSKVAIVGSGLIGCELAHDLLYYLKPENIHLYGSSDQLLKGYVPSQVGSSLERFFVQQGITVEKNRKIHTVEKDGHHYFLNKGGEPYQCVFSALGMNVDRLGTSLPVGKAFIADKQCRLSKDVFALGDCVEIEGIYRPYILPMMEQSRFLAPFLTKKQGTKTVEYSLPTVNVKTAGHPISILGLPVVSSTVEYHQEKEGIVFAYDKKRLVQICLYGKEAMSEKTAFTMKYGEQLSSP